MSKLLSNVLDKISEDNNEYRIELRNLNSKIDEITTAIVGDIVTLSNYNADFSNMISNTKEKLINPISRIIESYVIKDLRSVETVNEQFVEKINDKIDAANITSKDDKDKFIESLDTLLNEKYLEIVQIKRVDFFNEYGVNSDIEECVNSFIKELLDSSNYEESSLMNIFAEYKKNIYSEIKLVLSKISKSYLGNFSNEIVSALNSSIDYDDDLSSDDFKPYIPDINPVTEVEMPSIPDIEVPEIPSIPEVPFVPEIPSVPEMPVQEEINEEIQPMIEEAPITLTELEPVQEVKTEVDSTDSTKKLYDVEEILKIAKSPVVSMPEEVKEKDFIGVKHNNDREDLETLNNVFNEKEIVEEMIKRLQNRLDVINQKETRLIEEKTQLEEDENFVNDLIVSSNDKKQELDKFENSLNSKEEELKNKEKDLNEKINNIMPFANAVLNADK